MMVTTLALLATGPAHACGGFACNQRVPVLQNAERIVFAVDPIHDEVEMHVQISYTGEAQDFAWIVPVPDVPDLFLTSSALFNQLAVRTAPVFVQNTVDEGRCSDGRGLAFPGVSYDYALAGADFTATAASTAVSVVDQQLVGPYETVTLRAESTEALLSWLADNGYALPDGSDAALAPYVSDQGYFVALKLRKDADVGDLEPLALRYAGDRATVPVQLTSVSATPDMRLEAYVFSSTRAVPESYLHVQINEAAIDWQNFGQNYSDVITQAANEAGGHAFATDYYGPSDIAGDFFVESAFDEAALRSASTPTQWANALRGALVTVPPELFEVIEDQLGVGEGNGSYFWSCPECVASGFVHGADAATDDVMARVVDPMRAAQHLVDQFPELSRMTSSLDAVEMTVDPVFVLNEDMKATRVHKRHTSDMVYECGNGRQREKASRRLVLANGIEIDLPSQDWMSEHGLTDLEYITKHDLADYNALVIEQTGEHGQPVVLADFTSDLADLALAANRALGCGGCDSTSTRGAAGVAGALIALAARRRRR